MYMHVHMHINTCMYTYICMYIDTLYTYICMSACMYIGRHECMYMCVYIHESMYLCIHLCM